MIEAAFTMSAIIQHSEDFAIILALLLSNAVVGFTREHQAGNAIELLKQKLALKARREYMGEYPSVNYRVLVNLGLFF